METAGSLGLVAAGGGARSCAGKTSRRGNTTGEVQDKQEDEDKWNRGGWRTALEVHISGVYLGLRG